MTPALSRRSLLLASAAATAATATPLALRGTAAHATPPGQNGLISYTIGGNIYVANADGTNSRTLVRSAHASAPCWAPDGSRLLFVSGRKVRSIRPDGTGQIDVTGEASGSPVQATFAYFGGYVIWSDQGRLFIGGAGGNWFRGVPLFDHTHDMLDEHPTASAQNLIIFDRGHAGGEKAIYRYLSPTEAWKFIDNGAQPDFSPNGNRIAFVRAESGGAVRHIWIANADGTNQVQLTTTEAHGPVNIGPKWSPDGTSILYTSVTSAPTAPDPVMRIDVASKTAVTVVPTGSAPTWQPVNRNTVRRLSGKSRIEVTIATSQWTYADFGAPDGIRLEARTVTLARSDAFHNALGGAVLAVNRQGPLLISPTANLPAAVETEIKRVLGGSGTVYLLGGMSTPIESRLKRLGYTVDRVRGDGPHGTNVAIAKRITSKPRFVIIANAQTFHNGLAAAATAAGRRDTVVMLTDGNVMPAATAAYLNRLNPDITSGSVMICLGGLAKDALLNAYQSGRMPSWPSRIQYYGLVGNGPEHNARLIADFFGTSPFAVAVATSDSWVDALGGAAMIGTVGGPLLFTPKDALSPSVSKYLSAQSSKTVEAILLGGENALPKKLVAPIGDSIGLRGQWDYVTTPVGLSLRAATTPSPRFADGSAGGVADAVDRPAPESATRN